MVGDADHQPRVLLVDAGNQPIGTAGLEDLRVVGRASASAAPRAVYRNDPDVVIVTWTDGEDMLSLVRELSDAGAAVLVADGLDDADALLAALEAGAYGYVVEQQPRSQLARAVQVVDAGEPALPRALLRPLLDRLTARGRDRYVVRGRIESLTRRQREVLEHIVAGESSDQIAERLRISPQTTRKHVQQLLGRLGVHSRVEAVALVLRSDLGDLVMPRTPRARGPSEQR